MPSPADTPAPAAAPVQLPPYPRPAYAWYVVVVLLVAYILAFIDREVIALLVGPIKHDLQITDTQMSLLLGGAFALFYTGFGIPIAWLADHGNRRLLIFAGVFLWSLMTCSCGLSMSYWPLFASRVGVGVGEAALNPPALSLLKDYFPPDRMGRAIGLYTAGVSSGSGIAYVIAGSVFPAISAAGPVTWPVLGTLQPWQQMFVYVGAPGLLVALLVLTIREPLRRDRMAATEAALKKASPLWATIRFVFVRWKAYIVLFLALSVLAIMAYGIGFWIPEFLRRTYHLSDEELGYYIRWRGVVNIVFGLVGVVTGGVLCDLARKRYSDGYVRVCLFGFFFMTIGYTSFALMPTPGLAVAMLIPASFGAAAPTAAGAAAIIAIAPPNMRAQITALYYFTLNLVGLFVGPTAVALMTDYYFEAEDQLRYSLAVVAFFAAAIGTALLIYNLKPYRRSAEEAQAWSA